MNPAKRITAFIAAFALALAMALSGCGGGATAASSTSSSAASTSSAAQNLELYGKPWVTSVLSDNLPPAAPEAKDDLYTHFDYDYLKNHNGQLASSTSDYEPEIQDAVIGVIKDGSKTGHELEQLRIFYNQAADLDTVVATGFSDIQPYLDRIDAVASIDEMNALLTSDDFPFTPFITGCVYIDGEKDINIVSVIPDFVICNAATDGGTYYQDYDDPNYQTSIDLTLDNYCAPILMDYLSMGMDRESAVLIIREIAAFEKEHGKHLEGNTTYLKKDFGELSQAIKESHYDIDGICALCPNFPLKETLAKCGKANSPEYSITREWIEAFNALWTQENLHAIKEVAKANIVAETRALHDPSVTNQMRILGGGDALSSDAFAYTACNDLNTFAQVLAKIYVEEKLGPKAKAHLQGLSEQLIGEYKQLIGETSWMSEESKRNVTEKLDNMTLNILEPEGGYFSFDSLELVPSDKGGSLFSNYLKLKQYRYDCESKLIGQPAIRATIWFSITPTMMNAFYNPEENSINIFPGYVTSFTYGDDMDDNDLLGGMGWSIAHEISHGFDYQGAQLDAFGAPNPVVSGDDIDKFVTKCSALARYYQGIEMMPGMTVDGSAVAAEAAADLSGMQVTLEVLKGVDKADYTRFFERASLVWAQTIPAEVFPLIAADVHPLNNLRVNVSAQMFQPLYDAFGVSSGDGMYLEPNERIVMWGPEA